jgi:hypothetical protein
MFYPYLGLVDRSTLRQNNKTRVQLKAAAISPASRDPPISFTVTRDRRVVNSNLVIISIRDQRLEPQSPT